MSANDNIAPAVSLLSTGTDLTGRALPLFEVAWAALSYLFTATRQGSTAARRPLPLLFPLHPYDPYKSVVVVVLAQVPLLTIWALPFSAKVLGPLLRTALSPKYSTTWYSTLLSTTSPGRTKKCLHFHSYSGALTGSLTPSPGPLEPLHRAVPRSKVVRGPAS
jgi:hypothetical protein